MGNLGYFARPIDAIPNFRGIAFDNSWHAGHAVYTPSDDRFLMFIDRTVNVLNTTDIDGATVKRWRRTATHPYTNAHWAASALIGSSRADILPRIADSGATGYCTWVVPEGSGTSRLANATNAWTFSATSSASSYTFTALAAICNGARHVTGRHCVARDGMRIVSFSGGSPFSTPVAAPAPLNSTTGDPSGDPWFAISNAGAGDSSVIVPNQGQYVALLSRNGLYVAKFAGTGTFLAGPFGPTYDPDWPIVHFRGGNNASANQVAFDSSGIGWLIWEIEGSSGYSAFYRARIDQMFVASPSPTVDTLFTGSSLTNPTTDQAVDLVPIVVNSLTEERKGCFNGGTLAAAMTMNQRASFYTTVGGDQRAVVDTLADLPTIAFAAIGQGTPGGVALLAGGKRDGARYDGSLGRVWFVGLADLGSGLREKGPPVDGTDSYFWPETSPLGEEYAFFRDTAF